MRRIRSSLTRADRRLYRRLVRRRSPVADRALWAVSQGARRSALWLAIAALLAATGGRRERRAAARGVVAIGLASALVNGPLKLLWGRGRPSVPWGTPRRGLLRTPQSPSFPSGHAASAFAFATAVAAEDPPPALPVGALAAAVAYSRIHTGVHYPGDVVAGAAIGVAAGLVSGRLDVARRWDRRHPRSSTDAARPPRRAVLLVSPRAGSAGRLDRARRAMVEAGVEIVAEIPIDRHDELADVVARSGDEPLLVVAAGGDGTVGTAADHVAGTDAVLGILPLGTSNDFARSLGLPTDPVEAGRLLGSGTLSTIDAGRLVAPGEPPRHFVHAATVGLNVSFARLATQASLRRRFGRLTYAVAAARAVRQHSPFVCELHYDATSERTELLHLSVINAPVFGGFLGMRVRGARLDDRALDVIAVERLPIRRLLLAALHPILGLRRPLHGIRTLRVPSLRVHTEQPLDVALDGEVLGRIPADFEVAAEALRVVTRDDFRQAGAS